MLNVPICIIHLYVPTMYKYKMFHVVLFKFLHKSRQYIHEFTLALFSFYLDTGIGATVLLYVLTLQFALGVPPSDEHGS